MYLLLLLSLLYYNNDKNNKFICLLMIGECLVLILLIFDSFSVEFSREKHATEIIPGH